jgi:hypothetical protein
MGSKTNRENNYGQTAFVMGEENEICVIQNYTQYTYIHINIKRGATIKCSGKIPQILKTFFDLYFYYKVCVLCGTCGTTSCYCTHSHNVCFVCHVLHTTCMYVVCMYTQVCRLHV